MKVWQIQYCDGLILSKVFATKALAVKYCNKITNPASDRSNDYKWNKNKTLLISKYFDSSYRVFSAKVIEK